MGCSHTVEGLECPVRLQLLNRPQNGVQHNDRAYHRRVNGVPCGKGKASRANEQVYQWVMDLVTQYLQRRGTLGGFKGVPAMLPQPPGNLFRGEPLFT